MKAKKVIKNMEKLSDYILDKLEEDIRELQKAGKEMRDEYERERKKGAKGTRKTP
jgi:hypothetical protein